MQGPICRIGVDFHALYFKNEVSDPPIFRVSDKVNSLSDCQKSMKKICAVELFRANVLYEIFFSHLGEMNIIVFNHKICLC